MKKEKPSVKEHVESLRIDGLPNIARARHPLNAVFWSLLLAVNAGLCVWLIVKTVHEYNEHSVTTTTRYIPEQQSLFVTLTLCNMQPWAYSSYAAQLLAEANVSASSQTATTAADNYATYVRLQRWHKTVRGSYLNDTQKEALASSLDTMLVACSFKGAACSSANFTAMFHPFFLNCWRFNADASQYTQIAGDANALSLTLYAGTNATVDQQPVDIGFYLFVMILFTS